MHHFLLFPHSSLNSALDDRKSALGVTKIGNIDLVVILTGY